jgi:CubicO group peptidase (beta-lactamase class C family)
MIAIVAALIATQGEPTLKQQLEAFRISQNIVGMTVAVMRDGKLIAHESVGYRNNATKEPARNTDIYRLASVSKPITAVAILTLVDQGKIDLDKPARTYLTLPAGHNYTLRQLLSHTAGIRHYRPVPDPINEVYDHYPTQQGAMNLFINDPLIGQPREKYIYSTPAYTIAGAALESVAKMPFPAYLRKHIFIYAKPGELDIETPTPNNRRSALHAYVEGTIQQYPKPENLSWK